MRFTDLARAGTRYDPDCGDLSAFPEGGRIQVTGALEDPENLPDAFEVAETVGDTTVVVLDLEGVGSIDSTAVDHVADLLDDQRAPMIATMMERALHDPTFTAVRDELICDFEPAFRVLVDRGIESGQLRADVDVPLAMASIAGSFVFLRFMSPHGFDRDAAGRVLDEFVRSNAPR